MQLRVAAKSAQEPGGGGRFPLCTPRGSRKPKLQGGQERPASAVIKKNDARGVVAASSPALEAASWGLPVCSPPATGLGGLGGVLKPPTPLVCSRWGTAPRLQAAPASSRVRGSVGEAGLEPAPPALLIPRSPEPSRAVSQGPPLRVQVASPGPLRQEPRRAPHTSFGTGPAGWGCQAPARPWSQGSWNGSARCTRVPCLLFKRSH